MSHATGLFNSGASAVPRRSKWSMLPCRQPGGARCELWNNMAFALTLEAAIVVVGLYLFVSATNVARSKSIALVLLSFVAMVFTAVGMTVAPAPPSAMAMAGSSLGTLAVVCGLAYWSGRPARPA